MNITPFVVHAVIIEVNLQFKKRLPFKRQTCSFELKHGASKKICDELNKPF